MVVAWLSMDCWRVGGYMKQLRGGGVVADVLPDVPCIFVAVVVLCVGGGGAARAVVVVVGVATGPGVG